MRPSLRVNHETRKGIARRRSSPETPWGIRKRTEVWMSRRLGHQRAHGQGISLQRRRRQRRWPPRWRRLLAERLLAEWLLLAKRPLVELLLQPERLPA